MSDEEQDDKEGFMEEIKQKEIDDMVFAEAIYNSYRLLTKEVTFADLLAKETNDQYATVLTYDPDDGPALEELVVMIDYYVETEEYEKCAKIKVVMDEMFPESVITE
jgi:hypothetical protein